MIRQPRCLLLLAMLMSPLTASEPAIVHVAPAASGRGDGASPEDAAELQAALDRLPDGPARLVLAGGIYRGEYHHDSLRTTVLELVAERNGTAVIDGADPVTGWSDDDGDGVWEASFANDWGLTRHEVKPDLPAPTPEALRRETVWFDGVRLRPRAASDPAKPVAPAELVAGECTVDDAAKRLRLRPPHGGDPRTALIEATVRGSRRIAAEAPWYEESRPLLFLRTRSPITLRGLVVRRSGAGLGPAACKMETSHHGAGPDISRWMHDVVVEDCVFDDNTGVGFSASTIRNLLVRRCTFDGNGERGAGIGQLHGAVIEDCSFSRNNWRFGGWMGWWDAAGLKHFDGADHDSWFQARSRDVRLRRCRFLDNQANGYWQDYGGIGTVLEQCTFAGNRMHGLMQEVTPGPLTIADCVFERNALDGGPYGAIALIQSPDVTVVRSRFTGNGCGEPGAMAPTGVFLIAWGDRKAYGGTPFVTERLTINDCVVQADVPGSNVFYGWPWGDRAVLGDQAPVRFARSLRSDGNTWWRADAPSLADAALRDGRRAFLSLDPVSGEAQDKPSLTLDAWRQASGQDRHSTWQQVAGSVGK